ncbi:uncharacterized protein LOC111023625 [Momordica charantia]|uniref:Uncharacterized protein LOC111023625 n=1 Tax=Momordica charantia TaxID=3673 RepID=A0A6J1DW17_MOMCH|nr:uncharacterized protein LOC111023625 [Momordica charantia]
MTEAETRYPQMEKLALALVTSARRLRPYFQAHTMTVLTNVPLKQVFHKPETSGHLMKLAVELSEYDIQFEPRTAIKGQVVADFIAELALPSAQTSTPDQPWTVYVDGSSNEKGCGAGVLLLASDDMRFEYALRFNFRTSNNEAGYEALFVGLRMAKGLGATHLLIFSDSQLIVNQIREDYQTKDPWMEKYLGKVRSHLAYFQTYEIRQIPRLQISNADALAKLASPYETDLARSVPVEILDNPSILELDMMEIDSHPSSWMEPIKDFLGGKVPADPRETKKMTRKAARYLLRDGTLYRRGFSLPLLKFIFEEDGHYVLREVHERVCGNHLGARSLSAKVIRQGYYWPTMDQDAKEFVKVKYAVVAVDYFTKWAEAEALSTITEARVTNFIWTNVLCRFGIPNAIVTDNGRQFDNAKFKDFCRKLGISHLFSSPAQPKANGQVEAVNKIIKRGIKL